LSKVVTIRVPEWVDEKKLREIINKGSVRREFLWRNVSKHPPV